MKIAKIAAHSAPSWLPGKSRQEEDDCEREKAEDRHRLEDVEGRHDDEFGLPALRRECADHEGKQQRCQIAANMRKVVRNAYSGRFAGSSVTGATSSFASDAPISRAPCANNTKTPAIKIKMTTS